MKALLKKIEEINIKYETLNDDYIEGDEYSQLYDKYMADMESAIQQYVISLCDCTEEETTGLMTEEVCNICGKVQK